MENKRSPRKILVGQVVGDKADKTVAVSVERLFQHQKYKKIVKKTSKIYAHDENNEARIGDKVRVMSTRPLSKMKRWRIIEIIARAQ